MPTSRPIRLPGENFNERALPFIEVTGFKGLRLHAKSRSALNFRHVPSHRFSHPDAKRTFIYLAEDAETCLWECFGDSVMEPRTAVSRSIWMSRQLSEIEFTESLRICDLTDTKTRGKLKVDLSALKHTNLEIPQAWGLAILNHPTGVDGIRFASRFTNGDCMVLFENERTSRIGKIKTVGQLSELPGGGCFLDENEIALV